MDTAGVGLGLVPFDRMGAFEAPPLSTVGMTLARLLPSAGLLPASAATSSGPGGRGPRPWRKPIRGILVRDAILGPRHLPGHNKHPRQDRWPVRGARRPGCAPNSREEPCEPLGSSGCPTRIQPWVLASKSAAPAKPVDTPRFRTSPEEHLHDVSRPRVENRRRADMASDMLRRGPDRVKGGQCGYHGGRIDEGALDDVGDSLDMAIEFISAANPAVAVAKGIAVTDHSPSARQLGGPGPFSPDAGCAARSLPTARVPAPHPPPIGAPVLSRGGMPFSRGEIWTDPSGGNLTISAGAGPGPLSRVDLGSSP